MKIIVIGTSLSGKTTLVRYFRENTDLPIMEFDEELTRLNNGNYPADHDYKNNVLVPQIVKDILKKGNVVFFTNTDYFTVEDLKVAKESGFKIVQLKLSLEELKKRNELRVKTEGYDDLSQWFPGMLEYQNEIKQAGLVDEVIDVNQPLEKIVEGINLCLRKLL